MTPEDELEPLRRVASAAIEIAEKLRRERDDLARRLVLSADWQVAFHERGTVLAVLRTERDQARDFAVAATEELWSLRCALEEVVGSRDDPTSRWLSAILSGSK